jgi:hypothetical protein
MTLGVEAKTWLAAVSDDAQVDGNYKRSIGRIALEYVSS